MLHHFPHQSIDGRWHAVYQIPGCQSLSSVMDAACKQAIERECKKLNAEQQRKADKNAFLPPAERPIPTGFYTDGDAAA